MRSSVSIYLEMRWWPRLRANLGTFHDLFWLVLRSHALDGLFPYWSLLWVAEKHDMVLLRLSL